MTSVLCLCLSATEDPNELVGMNPSKPLLLDPLLQRAAEDCGLLTLSELKQSVSVL